VTRGVPALSGSPGTMTAVPAASPPTTRPTPTRRRSLVLLAAMLAVVALLGTGCVRVRAGLAVSPQDTVSGTIDVGTPDGTPGGTGPPLQVPSDLSSDVTVTRYEQDGYIGSHVSFQDLTFDDVSRLLPQLSPTTSSAIRLQLRRAGDRVILSGQVDLTRVNPESADVQLKMAFPGSITQTDGTVSQGVVSWTFTPGEVGQVNAVASYPDPNAPSWVSWALLLVAVVLVAAGVVFALAAATRPRVDRRARR
jgi:hypothetical protein